MASILCGHCGNYHANIEAVRTCALLNDFGTKPAAVSTLGQRMSMETSPHTDANTARPKSREQRMREQDNEALESGMYRTPSGDIFKIYKAVNGSGRMISKRLVRDGAQAEFQYEGLAKKWVLPEDRMTLEQAKEYGALYGVCCVCGRTLTDEKSIEAGIGPICAGRV